MLYPTQVVDGGGWRVPLEYEPTSQSWFIPIKPVSVAQRFLKIIYRLLLAQPLVQGQEGGGKEANPQEAPKQKAAAPRRAPKPKARAPQPPGNRDTRPRPRTPQAGGAGTPTREATRASEGGANSRTL